MNHQRHLPIVLLVLLMGACASEESDESEQKAADVKSIYSFVVKEIDGNDVRLGDFRGQVLLIVNVASKCGFTSQYEGLQSIYSRYGDRGFAVLGFPANNFGAQEPGTNAEIKTFCSVTHHVAFPMFSKISVMGEDQAPLYAFLTTANPDFAGEITWNFNKFLISRTGEIIARFESSDEPESPVVVEVVERALE